MTTTSLIVEIVVIGAFALVWAALFAFNFSGLDINQVTNWLIQYKDWSAGIVLGSIVISYQLGWSVNQLSYFVARKTFNKPIRRKVFKDKYKNYDSIKTTVYMQGSDFIVEKVKERLSVVRLTRSAFINFLFISIALFTLREWLVGFITLSISFVFFILANDMYSLYCNQILNAYKVITPIEEQSQAIDNKKKSQLPSKGREIRQEAEEQNQPTK